MDSLGLLSYIVSKDILDFSDLSNVYTLSIINSSYPSISIPSGNYLVIYAASFYYSNAGVGYTHFFIFKDIGNYALIDSPFGTVYLTVSQATGSWNVNINGGNGSAAAIINLFQIS